MVWTLDVGEFHQRSNQFKSYLEVQQAVLFAASTVGTVSKIREMEFGESNAYVAGCAGRRNANLCNRARAQPHATSCPSGL
jgi:hypothetical protein